MKDNVGEGRGWCIVAFSGWQKSENNEYVLQEERQAEKPTRQTESVAMYDGFIGTDKVSRKHMMRRQDKLQNCFTLDTGDPLHDMNCNAKCFYFLSVV